jgi:hypothetical protein
MKNEPIEFPYKKYRGTAIWKRVNKAVRELVANRDIVEQTPREYIVGYICKEISASKANGSR